MKLQRRRFLQAAAGAVMMPAVSRIASAQTYPSRAVRIVLGFPAGGSSDVIARLLAQWLSEHLGEPFIVDNRPGAASNIGTEMVARASPDGYTLLCVTSANAVNATLYDKLNFNLSRDIAPVVATFSVPNVMEVNPAVPANTVPEFIAYAKANPGKLNFASGGIGASQDVAAELFNFMAGVTMRHVPYRGSAPALIDLLGGQVQVMFDLMPSSIGYIRAGRLRALAVTTATRSAALPDLPTVGDFVPGYAADTWNGIGAPAGTPPEIVEKLNKEINAALTDPNVKARLADLGATALGGSPAAFGKLVADEIEKWGRVIKFAGIKAE